MVVMGLPTCSVITPDAMGILAQGTCAGNGQGGVLYNAVCSDTPKANEHATKVKAIAQKALDEAHDVMDDKTVRAS